MRVHVQGIAVDVCRDGKIIDHAAYYDEANLRMQLQPTTGRSSVRMHTQLLLKVQEEDAEGRTCVRCRLHVAPLGAPRPDEHQLTAQATMQRWLARKYLRQLAAFGADGFALSKACLEKAPLMLSTHAFARLLSGDKSRLSETSSQQAHHAHSLLGAPLLELLEPFFEAAQLVAFRASLANRRSCTELLHGTAADGSARSYVLVNSFFEHRVTGGNMSRYWATLLVDIGADMRSPGLQDGARRTRSLAAISAGTAAGGMGGKPAVDEALPSKTPCGLPFKPAVTSKSFGSLFVHRLPASWKWFDSKLMEETLTSAVHALDASFTMVDVTAYDQPMVWLSRGFERQSGIARSEASGRNCRFMQNDATDPVAVGQMKSAITAGQPVRVCVWNEGQLGGFWNLSLIHI